ncbi:PilZ domain-containing protein [Roseomonas chloroacetimidivorans]|uniref:PilZ domain-containing protein n=1 Tax=Roseomonas chloroacetimidivorans TaxID=1766656 RepID=UPI003C723074
MERRRAARQQVIRLGQLAVAETPIRCVVFDLSRAGARIHLFAPCAVPETVILRLPDGTIRQARRRWQRDAAVGLEFSGMAASGGSERAGSVSSPATCPAHREAEGED